MWLAKALADLDIKISCKCWNPDCNGVAHRHHIGTATMTNDLFVVMNCSEVVDDHVNHDELRIVVNMTRIVVGCNICLR